jgi:hypothetical protein
MVQQMPLLEPLICLASKIPKPLEASTFHLGDSPQQVNPHDCGVIATSNILTILGGGEPTSTSGVDANTLRLEYASLILKRLQRLPNIRDRNLSDVKFAIPPGPRIESYATDTVRFEANSALPPANMSEEIPQEVASAADSVQDWQSEPPRQSQRVRKTVERYESASEQVPSRLQSPIGLSHRQKVATRNFKEL